MNSTFQVDDKVRWTSSNLAKEGIVVAVIPSHKSPLEMGIKIDGSGGARDHTSYIIRGGAPGQAARLYWPVVSLLAHDEGLTAQEVKWCHDHADLVRRVIQDNHEMQRAAVPRVALVRNRP
jgi:hypothetical protein